jgi:Kef-type K+ transport system membrane component KefB
MFGSGSGHSGVWRGLALSSLLVLGAIGVFFAAQHFGQSLVPLSTEVASVTRSGPPSHTLLHVLLALAAIIVAARVLGVVFRRLGQPQVIGEVVAGIVLGPSLLGQFAPAAQAFLLPASVAPYLSIVAQVGVVLFMFLVGVELDTRALRERSQATLAISQASIALPFSLGLVLALFLYPSVSLSGVSFTNFALFMGVSMSVTAFPVLARLLTDRGLQRTHLGVMALACAAFDDVTAWCLLALVVGIVNSTATTALVTFGLSAVYVVFMLVLVRPAVAHLVRKAELRERLTQGWMAWLFVGLLLSALVTEAIGIHALFGAFLLGAIIPHDSLLAREVSRRLEDLVVLLLLPAFFAFSGLRTQIGLLGTTTDWLWCLAIIGVASLGKFGGASLAARISGMRWADAFSIGVLMNTRGLMELIVLNVGLDLGVISPRLFAMLVIMAVVTTMITGPALSLIERVRGGAPVAGRPQLSSQ